MYFKSLTLRGFLCYKDTTTITFDPRFNVIIGPNGSGKSSLLAGIRFIMGESACAADKERVLHRGVSSRVLVGYVAAVLDNSDGRMAGLDASELHLRRDFGQNKDEFTLNGKKLTRQAWQSLLEAAGFSKTNPYYFVHQHEVSGLTRMSNEDRLQLLKEVGGTRVYDERRSEALKSLEETKSRRKAIDATLETIISRMNELREEQQELKQYMELEKEKHVIEAILLSKDLQEATQTLDALDASVFKSSAALRDLNSQINNINESMESVETLNSNSEEDLKRLTKQEKDLKGKLTAAQREEARLSLALKSKQQAAEDRRKEKSSKEKNLKAVESELKQTEEQLNQLNIQKDKLEDQTRKEEHELQRARQELNRLQQKAKRKENFSSAIERNNELSKIIKLKETEMKIVAKQKNEFIAQMKSLEESMNTSRSIQLQNEFSQVEEALKLSSDGLNSTKLELSQSLEQQISISNEVENLQKLLYRKDEDLYHTIKRLRNTMRVEQSIGNEAAIRWATETGSSSSQLKVCYGTLLENIRVNPEFYVAVETAGGAQLFNLLVLDRRIAIEIVNYIKTKKEGTVTLTPIEDIKNRNTEIASLPFLSSSSSSSRSSSRSSSSSSCSDDDDGGANPHLHLHQQQQQQQHHDGVRRLVDVIQCDQKIKPAVDQVFGKFLLVDSRDIGNKYKSFGFDCITLEGDMISRKGVLKGGFVGHQKRMLLQQQINDLKNEIGRINQKIESLKNEEESTKTKIKKLQKANSEKDTQIEKLRVQRNNLKSSLIAMERENSKYESRRKRFDNQIKEAEIQIEFGKDEIQKLRGEISMPTLENLTTEEEKRMNQLFSSVPAMEISCEEKQNELLQFTSSLSAKEFRMNEVLKIQIEHIKDELSKLEISEQEDEEIGDAAAAGDDQNNKEGSSYKLQRISMEIATLKNSLSEIENSVNSLQISSNERKQELQNMKLTREVLKQKMDELESELQLRETRMSIERKRRDEILSRQQLIVGSAAAASAAAAAVDSSRDLLRQSRKELTNRLGKVSKQLRAFDDVNRRASDQYTTFIDEETHLLTQRDRLYKEEESVLELMQSLDDQKESTLIKTFENVNKHFLQVFSEIVAGGKAKLVLKKLCDEDVARLLKANAAAAAASAAGDGGDGGDGRNQLALVNESQTTMNQWASPTAVDVLTGVAIKVQFPAFKRYLPLESLSGGQKSVTALSLIFALQRVDSAPFYVLDEVDASLDSQFRGSLARLIQSQSRLNQIIVITHKSETISVADKFLLTSLVNQATTVAPTTLEEALQVSQRLSIIEDEELKKTRSKAMQ